MYTSQLVEIGRSILPNFIGVYPLDKVPKGIKKNSSLIVNTDTHRLEGKHWIAVSYERDGKMYVYDSFGYYYPHTLIGRLLKSNPREIVFNNRMDQLPWEKNCGLRCLAFLKTRV